MYLAQIILTLTDKDKRKLTLEDIQNLVRPRLTGIPDCLVSVSVPSPVGGTGADLELEFAGDDLKKLDEFAVALKDYLQTADGFRDVDVSTRSGKPKLRIIPNRAVLSDIKFTPVNLGLALRANLEGINAGVFKKGDRSYDIVVKYSEKEGKKQVSQFLFPGKDGKPVMLESLGRIEEQSSPVQITRKDKRRVSKLYCNLISSKPLGVAAKDISKIIEEKIKLPVGYNYNFPGMFERMEESQRSIGEAGIIAMILLVLTLAAILESYKQPLIILLTLPLMIPGMFWGLFLTGHSISIFVSMSAVMMIGIVVNNGILIIEDYNFLMRKRMPKGFAMIKSSANQLRPIIMITLAAVLGMLPLAIGRGIGSELRNDIGVASVGGILVSGLLTIIVIPLAFNLIIKTKKNAKLSRVSVKNLGIRNKE